MDGNGGDVRFDKTSDEYHFAAGDFTIEMFARRLETSSNQWLISYYETSGNQRSWGIRTASSTQLEMFMSSNGSSVSNVLTWGNFSVDGNFHHIVVVREGSTLSAFIDGVRVATTTNSTNLFNSSTSVRLFNAGGSSSRLDAVVDGLRIVKGEALYDPTQTTLTVPTSYYSVGDPGASPSPAVSELRASQALAYAGTDADPEQRISQAVPYVAYKVAPPLLVTQALEYYGYTLNPAERVSQSVIYAAYRSLTPCGTQRVTAWKITRRDGQQYFFTSHDEEIYILGDTYTPCNSLSRSAVEISSELGTTDNMDITGVIADAAISVADLFVGAFDGAEIEVYEVDWTPSPVAFKLLAAGTAGRLQQGDTGYKFEVVTASQKMQTKALLDQVTPNCRWELGSPNVAGSPGCGVDLEALRVSGAVTSVGAQNTFRQLPKRVFTDTSRAEADDYFKLGKLTWTTGDNAGLIGEIKEFASGQFTFWQEFRSDIKVGDAYTVVPGCNKLIDGDCLNKFNNVENHGGFAFLPGRDFIQKRGDR